MGPSLRAHHRPTKFFNGPSARHSINCSWRRFCAAFSPLIFCSASLRAVSRKAVTFGGFHPVKYCHVSTPGELPPRLNRDGKKNCPPGSSSSFLSGDTVEAKPYLSWSAPSNQVRAVSVSLFNSYGGRLLLLLQIRFRSAAQNAEMRK